METSEEGRLVCYAEAGRGEEWQTLKKKEDEIHHAYCMAH